MSEALAATVGVRAGVGLTVGARVGAEVGEAVGIDAAFAGQEGHESQPYNKKPRKKLTSKTSVGRLWKIVVKLIKFRNLLQIGWMGFHPEVSPAFTFLQVPAAHLTGFDLQVDFGTHRQEAPHLMQLGILDSAQKPDRGPDTNFFPRRSRRARGIHSPTTETLAVADLCQVSRPRKLSKALRQAVFSG